jgi:hypothetical protein
MAQITSVTSEALQAKIRELLPSQQGFGEDLQAQNVIVPIIDLTAAAEGSGIGTSYQQALAFGSQTSFQLSNGNTDLANTAGFWRLTGVASYISVSTAEFARINLIDATPTTKIAWELGTPAGKGNNELSESFDYIIFLASGEKINVSASLRGVINGSYRQVADANGNLTNPSGFTPQ